MVWLVVGLVIYFLYSRHHSRLRHGKGPVPDDEGSATPGAASAAGPTGS